jgi:hypothetical protein
MIFTFLWKTLKVFLFISGFYFLSYGIASSMGCNPISGGCIFGGIASIIVSFLMTLENPEKPK